MVIKLNCWVFPTEGFPTYGCDKKMPIVTPEPNLIQTNDVAFSASVSEAVGNKIGSSLNYVLLNFDIYEFGVSGNAYSSLSGYPYFFMASTERIRANCSISDILVTNEISGISGTTSFNLQRQLATGGGYTDISVSNTTISNTADDGISFKYSDLVYPAGVGVGAYNLTTLGVGDRVRFVLVGAADQASTLNIKLVTRPV